MEITKSNFNSQIEDIKSAISNATFLAIDCEFSGLNFNADTNINPYDSYEQYYNKSRENIKKFLVLQFGLCTFRYDKNEKKFKQKCYNFYLFPRPTHRSISDQRFICQASSIDFLAGHNFDFNKVFKEGISYLNQTEELKYRQILEEKDLERKNNTSSNDHDIIPIPKEDQCFVDQTMEIINSFIKSNKAELMLPQCNAFRRRLIFQTTREKLGPLVSLETRVSQNKDRILYVMKPESPEEKAQKQREKFEASLAELDEAVGFSRIVQHISESRKLIIGHNLCLDLLHIIDKFLTPLPDYSEFKECAKCLFPKILDTKFMASSGVFKNLINNTVLSSLLNIFKSKPFEITEIDVEENGVGYSLKDDKEHEAGYDAFLTGLCFLTMMKYLHNFDDLYRIIEQGNSKILKPYINKIFLQKLQDGYINLSGNDGKLDRDHVLHVTFPKNWKLNDLTQLFSPFGNIHVAWLNETSAYIALYKRDQTSQALYSLSKNDLCTVMRFSQFQAKINGAKQNIGISEPSERKKRKKDSSSSSTISHDQSMSPIIMDNQKEDDSEQIATKMTKMFDENSTWD